MSHKLSDITLYYYPHDELSKQFTLRQNVVSDLYVQYIGSYKPPKTSRISVMLGEEDLAAGHLGSIITVHVKFDKAAYWEQSDHGKNRVILDTIHRVALLCAEKYNWDTKPFENAYNSVLNKDFKYAIEGKRKPSKNREHKAAILICKNLESAIISVNFYDKFDNYLKSVELLKSFQHEMFYGNLTRNNKWFGNNEFGIYTANEELVIKAAPDSEKPVTIINPMHSTREELEGYLRRATYREFNSQEDLINWMNR